MVSITDLIILILATYKISHLFALEDGPFEILSKFRDWAGVSYSEHSVMQGTNEFSKGLICLNCNSMWFGIVIVIFYVLCPIAIWLLLPIAISGMITVINNG